MSLSDEWPIERRVASLLSAEFHPADRNGAQLTREKASEKCQMLPAGCTLLHRRYWEPMASIPSAHFVPESASIFDPLCVLLDAYVPSTL